MRKFCNFVPKLLVFGACTSLCADTTEEINSLHRDLVACTLQRSQFLRGVDRTQCLPKICALYKQLHQIEQKAQVTPVKNAEELAICELAQAQTEAHQNKLCSDLATLDHSLAQFREKHHTELSALDRRILELTKAFLQQLSPEEKKRLKELSSQYTLLRQRLTALGENTQQKTEASQRQDAILDVLFL